MAAQAIKGLWGGESVNYMPVVCYCAPEACVLAAGAFESHTVKSEGVSEWNKAQS